MVSILFNVNALLVQWTRRYRSAPNSWVSLMTFWFFDRFGVDPFTVFSQPLAFSPVGLPPFYAALLQAWKALNGSITPNGFAVCSFADNVSLLVSSFSCKLCYQLGLAINPCRPHCVHKFASSFGALDWSSTWRFLLLMPFDRQVIDLNWKIAHGVLYTAERLNSFGYDIPTSCFCGHHMESLEHLFFSCPLSQSGIGFIQSLLFCTSPLAPSINVRHFLFGFNSDELLCVPRVFCYLLNLCKFLVWCQCNDYRFRLKPLSALGLIACLKSRVKFYLPLFSRRFVSRHRHRFFQRQWGANGVVGCVSDGGFKVFF